MNTTATHNATDIIHVDIDKSQWKKNVALEQKKQIMNAVLASFRKQAAFSEWQDVHIFHYTSRALLRFWDESTSKEMFLQKVSDFANAEKTPPPPVQSVQEYPMFVASMVASRPRQQNVNQNSAFTAKYWEKLNDVISVRHFISPHLTLLERQCRDLEELNTLPLSVDDYRSNTAKIQSNIALGSFLIRLHREMAMPQEQRQNLAPPTERDYQALLAVEKILKKNLQE